MMEMRGLLCIIRLGGKVKLGGRDKSAVTTPGKSSGSEREEKRRERNNKAFNTTISKNIPWNFAFFIYTLARQKVIDPNKSTIEP
jgi:hypothetical protein